MVFVLEKSYSLKLWIRDFQGAKQCPESKTKPRPDSEVIQIIISLIGWSSSNVSGKLLIIMLQVSFLQTFNFGINWQKPDWGAFPKALMQTDQIPGNQLQMFCHISPHLIQTHKVPCCFCLQWKLTQQY